MDSSRHQTPFCYPFQCTLEPSMYPMGFLYCLVQPLFWSFVLFSENLLADMHCKHTLPHAMERESKGYNWYKVCNIIIFKFTIYNVYYECEQEKKFFLAWYHLLK